MSANNFENSASVILIQHTHNLANCFLRANLDDQLHTWSWNYIEVYLISTVCRLHFCRENAISVFVYSVLSPQPRFAMLSSCTSFSPQNLFDCERKLICTKISSSSSSSAKLSHLFFTTFASTWTITFLNHSISMRIWRDLSFYR